MDLMKRHNTWDKLKDQSSPTFPSECHSITKINQPTKKPKI